MALLGQASGGFTESSSALRILQVGVRNTVGQLHSSAFTQSNPVSGAGNQTTAPGLLTNVLGVLSGSVAFTRGTTNEHGGPIVDANCKVLGVFINNASGNAFENQPGVASNRGPYVSAQGTYANRLYETVDIDAGAAITYLPGQSLVSSLNGFLTTSIDAAHDHADGTVIGILKIAPDSTSDELVYDQRI